MLKLKFEPLTFFSDKTFISVLASKEMRDKEALLFPGENSGVENWNICGSII